MCVCVCIVTLWFFSSIFLIYPKFRSLTRARVPLFYSSYLYCCNSCIDEQAHARAHTPQCNYAATISFYYINWSYTKPNDWNCLFSFTLWRFVRQLHFFLSECFIFFVVVVFSSIPFLTMPKVLIWLNLQYVSKSLPFALIAPRIQYVWFKRKHRSTSKSTRTTL